jgi:hypothetical protein
MQLGTHKMDILVRVRTMTSDADLKQALDKLPPKTSKPYACKVAKLRGLIDNAQCPPSSLAAVVLGDVHASNKLLQDACSNDSGAHAQAIEAILALLKHAMPDLPAPMRDRYQRAWRQAYAAVRESYVQQREQAQRDEVAQGMHVVKLKALTAAVAALPPGDQDRCMLVLILRMGARLSNDLIARLGSIKVYHGSDAVPAEDVVEDFVVVARDLDDDASYLAFRDRAGSAVTQVRAILPADVACEIRASLDLRPRAFLFVQRGGQPYTAHASFRKRQQQAVASALAAAGQAAVTLKDALAVARNPELSASIINSMTGRESLSS